MLSTIMVVFFSVAAVAQQPANMNVGNRYGNAISPVRSDSINTVRNNFGDRRNTRGCRGCRCHAGVDVITKSPYATQAMADGQGK